MEWQPNLTCPGPCFLLLLVWGGWWYCLGFSLRTGISLLVWWGGTFWCKNMSNNVKNGKETLSHLSFAGTAFYFCSCGEGDGSVSIISPGPGIWIMARLVGKNLIGKYQIIKSMSKIVNIFSSPHTHSPCLLLLLAAEWQPWCLNIQSGGWGMNHGVGPA